MLQVRAARFFVREHPHELAVRARVVTSGQQQPDTGGVAIRRVHHYILWQEELTVHPLSSRYFQPILTLAPLWH